MNKINALLSVCLTVVSVFFCMASNASVDTCLTKVDGENVCIESRFLVPADLGPIKSVSIGDNIVCLTKTDSTLACFPSKHDQMKATTMFTKEVAIASAILAGSVAAFGTFMSHTGFLMQL